MTQRISNLRAIGRRLDARQRRAVASTVLLLAIGVAALSWFATLPDDGERPDAAQLGAAHSVGRMASGLDRSRRAEATIEGIHGVVDAVVTATPDGVDGPRATVMVTLADGIAFVAVAQAAVEQVSAAFGIATHRVTAIDALSFERFGGEASSGEPSRSQLAHEFLALQAARSAALQRSAQQMLERMYPSRALVTVNVDLNPRWENLEERIEPEYPILIAEGEVDGSSEGTPTPRIKRWEPFVGTRDRFMLAPDIRRLSVALVLDRRIDPAQHQRIERAVKGAVGFVDYRDNGEGDRFELLVEQLVDPDAGSVAGAGDGWSWIAPHLPVAGNVVAIALVLLFLRGMLRSSRRPPRRSRGVPEEEPCVPEPTPQERARALRAEIEERIAEDPPAMSRLLEGWLAEQKS